LDPLDDQLFQGQIPGMRIEFRDLAGQSHALSAGATARVRDIRASVSSRFSIAPSDLVFVHRGSVLSDAAKLTWVAPTPSEFILVYDMTSDPSGVVLPDIERAALRAIDACPYMSPSLHFPSDIAVDIMHERIPELPLSRIFEALRAWDGNPYLAGRHLMRVMHERRAPDNPAGPRDWHGRGGDDPRDWHARDEPRRGQIISGRPGDRDGDDEDYL
jgi:hypothetical protein